MLVVLWGRSKPSVPSEANTDAEAEARAWEVYRSHADWIGKVDTKASILLALQGVLLGVVISLTDTGKPFACLRDWWDWVLFVGGIAVLLVAAVMSVLVIAPRVRVRRHQPDRKAMEDYTYFGHSRWWDPQPLAAELRKPALGILARQIRILGQVAWRKHLWAMWSVWLTVGSGVLFAVLAVLQNLGV